MPIYSTGRAPIRESLEWFLIFFYPARLHLSRYTYWYTYWYTARQPIAATIATNHYGKRSAQLHWVKFWIAGLGKINCVCDGNTLSHTAPRNRWKERKRPKATVRADRWVLGSPKKILKSRMTHERNRQNKRKQTCKPKRREDLNIARNTRRRLV